MPYKADGKMFVTKKAYKKYLKRVTKDAARTRNELKSLNGQWKPTTGVGVTTTRNVKNPHTKKRFALT